MHAKLDGALLNERKEFGSVARKLFMRVHVLVQHGATDCAGLARARRGGRGRTFEVLGTEFERRKRGDGARGVSAGDESSFPALVHQLQSDEGRERENAPPQELKVHLERVLADSIKDGVHSTIDPFSTGDLVHLCDDIDVARVEDDLVAACGLCERSLFRRRGGTDNVGAVVLCAVRWA